LQHGFRKSTSVPTGKDGTMAQRIPFGFNKEASEIAGEGIFLIAIPVFRGRVAPVLDWCSTIHLYPEVSGSETPEQELFLTHATTFDRMRILRVKGVRTLICGVLSPDLLHYGQRMGIRIIHGVAGEVREVLRAYLGQKLDHPRFRLPGCKGPRNYREGCKGVCAADAAAESCPSLERRKSRGRQGGEGGRNRGLETGAKGKIAAGPGGSCLCPECGARIPHRNGIPCGQVPCPACGRSMVRG